MSIITVNYNNLEGLKKTIKSIITQTWQAFELIVIDGGSTDGSLAFIEENHASIDYWVSEIDKGVYHAMNKGIAKANGEYLLFLNSGDHFYNETVLEDNHTQLNGKDIIYFNLNVIEGNTSFIKLYPNILSFSYFVEDTLPHPATFIKREAFSKTNLYNEDFRILSDWKFFIDAICQFNLSYMKIEETLSTFYIGGMSSNPENRSLKYQERQQVLTTSYPAYLQDMDDVLKLKKIVATFRKSRIIKLLVKLRFLNRF
ncbi:glycosyltransferase [Tamlana carrageenivorans]|uniref:Glycosyltransferase n=1 Tax=Pseudotamlana carrageenivorans TaxID=2069432 RepID=A0A2I7SMV0_9FLAO|nr:glycosyltransferase [Tamlana carrageenivorans]